jgi:hypothetical protein
MKASRGSNQAPRAVKKKGDVERAPRIPKPGEYAPNGMRFR